MEVTAPKPGNVHPQAAFEDVTYADFVQSAAAVAPILARTDELGIGRTMFEAVQATQTEVGRNTNLGIILLLAPLAAVPQQLTLDDGISSVLEELTIDDARGCYAAIRLAAPGGLGTVKEKDVTSAPTIDLVSAMRLAAERDRVAAQFANGYRDVLTAGLPRLVAIYNLLDWKTSIVQLHLELMAQSPETLIVRKCGREMAVESMHRAQRVLEAGWPESAAGQAEIKSFDRWLRADGHRRNPGTTADLVAAILFAALREKVIAPPPEFA